MRSVNRVLLAGACALAACRCGSSDLVPVECGDGVCAAPEEGCASCAKDCACQAGWDCALSRNACFELCGDGACRAADGESCATCPEDCGCGADAECRAGTCRPFCGDGRCDDSRTETCASCEADCACASVQECHEGACRLRCGNGTCDASEGCQTCASDCPCAGSARVCLDNQCKDTCGNSACDRALGEDCASCATDCACAEGTCDTATGQCEGPCDPQQDCVLSFAHSGDLLVNAGGANTVKPALAVDPAGTVFAGHGEGEAFPVRRLSGGAFGDAGGIGAGVYFWGTHNLVATGTNALFAQWEQTGSGTHLRTASSSNGGSTWSASRQLDVAGTSDNGKDGALAFQAGTIYAAYSGFVTGCTQSSCYEVFFAKSVDGGATWTAAKRLSTDTDQDDAVAVAVDGSLVVVAWNTFDGDLRVARSTDGGATFGAAQRVNDVAGKARVYGSGFVAVRGTRVHVVWSDERSDSEGDVYMDTSLDSGATWGADQPVHAVKTRYQEQPSVGIAPNGRAWVAWQDHRGGDYDVYVAATYDGSCFCRSVRFNRTTTDTQSNPRLLVDAQGRLHAAWRHENGSAFDIRYNSATP